MNATTGHSFSRGPYGKMTQKNIQILEINCNKKYIDSHWIVIFIFVWIKNASLLTSQDIV